MLEPLGIDHIAVAVRDLDAATRAWTERLGVRLGARETVPGQGVEVQMLYAGATRIELMRPLTPDSPVGRFLEKRGPGLHHLALSTLDCGGALAAASQAGARLVDETPQAGAGGSRVGFLHPASLEGVLVELVEGAGREETPA